MDRIGRVFDQIFETDIIYHLVFWLVFYFFLIIVTQGNGPLSYAMGMNLVRVIFYSIAVYINLLILFPRLLAKHKYLSYILSLSALILIIAPLESLLMYLFTMRTENVATFLKENLGSVFILSFFVASSSSIYKIINDWFVHQREKVDLKAQSLSSELKYLKSQINPHFLFNTLNSLYALTLKKSDLAPEIVLRLSEMMRYMLYECNEKTVPLEKEINYIKNYLELEKIRHGEKFTIQFDLDGAIKNQKIAPLMFMPFIENSFKHGLDSQLKSGYVNINITVDEEQVELNVDNSNPTVTPSSTGKKSGGVGLTNIKRRLKLIYPNSHDLNIDKTPNSYHVKLKINFTQ